MRVLPRYTSNTDKKESYLRILNLFLFLLCKLSHNVHKFIQFIIRNIIAKLALRCIGHICTTTKTGSKAITHISSMFMGYLAIERAELPSFSTRWRCNLPGGKTFSEYSPSNCFSLSNIHIIKTNTLLYWSFTSLSGFVRLS